MLGRGRLRGWTHVLGFGYPSGELTPFGPELWVALVRVATLGRLPWIQTYAVAFSAVVAFALGSIYVFTKRFFGRGAGIIAAAVWALDAGDWYQGGWFWLEWLGVWPVTLGMSFTMLALVKLADVIAPDAPQVAAARREHKRDIIWASLWILASLITHQLSLVVYVVTLPCLLLAEGVVTDRLTRAGLLRFGAAVALGFGLAAFYLVPMLTRTDLTQDLGVRGASLDDLAHRVVEMRLFEKGWSPIVVMGLFGCAVAATSRRGLSRSAGPFFVLSAASFVLLASDLLVGIFHVERALPGILKIECPRMLLVAKLFWFPLAGHAAVSVFRRLPATPAAAPPAPRSPLRVAVVCLLVALFGAPLLKPVALHIFNTQITKQVEHRRPTPIALDLRDLLRWSSDERRTTDEPYRIAYTLNDQHDHIISLAPVFDDTLFYKVGYTSAQQFVRFPMSGEPELLSALSVKYVVADHDLPRPAFVLQKTFGMLRLYRLAAYQPKHPFTLTGAGQVQVIRLEPETVALRLAGVAPGARLKLHVALYPRWEATLNGRHLPITPAPVYGIEYPILMEVPAADGELVFSYVRRAPDWAGLLITLGALGVLGFCVSGRARSLVARRWSRSIAEALGGAAPILGYVCAVAAALVFAFAIRGMASPARLASDSPFVTPARSRTLTLAGNQCEARGPAVWQCGPQELRTAVVSGLYGSHHCLTAPLPGPLVLSVDTELGSFVRATYDAVSSGTGQIRVLAGDSVLAETPTRGPEQGLQFLQIDTRSRAGQSAPLRFEIVGAPLRCFDFEIVR